MKKTALILLLALCFPAAPKAQTYPAVVPTPVNVVPQEGSFSFSRGTIIVVENPEQYAIADDLAQLFTASAGFTPRVKTGGGKGDIYFTTDMSLAPEAYLLDISPKRISVCASDAVGFFYAVQTMRQLLPATLGKEGKKTDAKWSIPAMRIEDAPRFGYRGMQLDVSRYFIPKQNVLRLIECMAMLKLNKLHLHLTDDNGWRLEIKRYPRLTEIGAWRVDRPGIPFPARRNPEPGEPTPVGGFYTQDDIREMVAYAAARHIEIIPEIEMPAHANAALAAYPELACPVVDEFIGVLPGLGGSHADIIFCAGNDRVFEFLQNILDEVMELFPSNYIHLGGDEAWKTYWKKCPLCQSRIHDEHLDSTEELQGWFMERMCSYVRGKGRKVIGWDELTNSKLPEGVIIHGWQGYGDAALIAAEQGHHFIMSPARIMYLIRYQGPQWFEPLTYFGNNTLRDVYDYEPVQQDWPAEYEELLMGVQACLWTEFCESPSDVEYLLFPRLAALAETVWCPRGTKDWPGFIVRLDSFLPHLDAMGVDYSHSMYNIQHGVTPDCGRLRVELECIRPDVEIRYTTDGREPDATSPLYVNPLLFDGPLTVKCATFASGKQMGALLELPLMWNKATAKKITNALPEQQLMVNGVRGSLRYTDLEWCTWESCDSIALIVDLERSETFRRISLGVITNYGMAVHKPSFVRVEVSHDNKHFTEIAGRSFDPEEIFREGTFREDITFDTHQTTGRYVRIFFRSAGPCPLNHIRPGQNSKVYVDEILIE